jgi:tetratricopeptide (TPR) repeat protein
VTGVTVDSVPDEAPQEVGRVEVRDSRGVQVGPGSVQINVSGDAPRLQVARSAYLEQVRRIAPSDPPGLKDRETELAELARFCLDPNPKAASYAWWRADPWAGKSALLSTFVLRPPAEVAKRVQIVSFFITARLAAQDTRESFTEVLMEQLAALLEQPLPAVQPEATREAYLLSLLSQAATSCQGKRKRLVLVVDGLDEDRGATTGPDAHSIAGLLPADPAAGMRVIVAGRPNPPIPDDVPNWHPLRNPEIIRPLSRSPHARDAQRLGRQELQRLLGGSMAEQEVLGLLAAGRGGLSCLDLAELADVTPWAAERILHTAPGRTFGSRPSLHTVGNRPEVYLLGHEELQGAAVYYLHRRLAGYRERLHAWAASYHARGWPPDTPEYLLSGYFRLLEDLADLPRMIQFALDTARHHQMVGLPGGNAVALAEIRSTLEFIASKDEPDLASALMLACYRDHLANRNGHAPDSLSDTWGALPQLPRAEADGPTTTTPYLQARALAKVAGALARTGQHRQAEAVARAISNPGPRVSALAWVGEALARAGESPRARVIAEEALTVARSVTDLYSQAITLAQVAGTLAQAGEPLRARDIAEEATIAARSTSSPFLQAITLVQVARALVQAGESEQARVIAEEAATVARSVTDLYSQAITLAQVAETLAQSGEPLQARVIAEESTAMVRPMTRPNSRATALAQIAGALAQAGESEQARVIAEEAIAASRTTTDPFLLAITLAQIAGALARAGESEQARVIAEEAIAAARPIPDASSQANALAQIAEILAHAGETWTAAKATAALCAIGQWWVAVTPVLMLAPSPSGMLSRVLKEQAPIQYVFDSGQR